MKSDTITEDSIRTLVNAFYARVLKDPALAPVFTEAVGTTHEDWAPHLKHMYDFWSSIALGTGRYHRNPMQAHVALPRFDLSLFDRWLELFAQTAHDTHGPEAAEHFIDKSRRIAATLKRGLEEARA